MAPMASGGHRGCLAQGAGVGFYDGQMRSEADNRSQPEADRQVFLFRL